MYEAWLGLDEVTDEIGGEVRDPASAAGFKTKLKRRFDEDTDEVLLEKKNIEHRQGNWGIEGLNIEVWRAMLRHGRVWGRYVRTLNNGVQFSDPSRLTTLLQIPSFPSLSERRKPRIL